MPRREPIYIDFRPSDRAAVLARMDQLGKDANGWLNLKPALEEDEPPPPPSLFGFLTAKGPEVPLCTWVPGQPEQVGIQHPAGRKGAEVLRNLGVPVPDGWRVTQDHSRRGLVAVVPEGTAHETVLDWLLRAGTALAADLSLAGWCRAAVYERG